MKSKMKQILSVVMTVCMLSTMVPLTTYGADFDSEGSTVVTEDETPVSTDVSVSEDGASDASDESVAADDAFQSGEEEEPFSAGEEDTFSAGTEEEEFSDEALAASAGQIVDGYDKSIVMVDCGRKYFSVNSLEKIIDSAASAGMHSVMLGIGNDGLRFLLDDMSLTVGSTNYSSYEVTQAIHEGNEAYHNFDVDELTQNDMDTILQYANTKGVEIIPLINSPGHMDAILSAMKKLGLSSVAYSTSKRTIDVTNSTATDFTKALLLKYITYFASKGCQMFNMGADEYGNDVNNTPHFQDLIDNGQYKYYVQYINNVAQMIKNANMQPMAFNDGIYYNENTSNDININTDIVICYWSNGWSGYTPASASFLVGKGFKLINTNSSYYWVLGGDECSFSKAKKFQYKKFQHRKTWLLDSDYEIIDKPAGAMFCIWCDKPDTYTYDQVVDNVSSVISAFGGTLPLTSATNIHSNVTPSDTPTIELLNGTLDSVNQSAELRLSNNSEVKWTSSNTRVISLESVERDSSDSIIATSVTATAKKAGKAIITAETGNGIQYTTTFDVKASGSDVSVTDQTIKVGVGQTVTEVQAGVNNEKNIDSSGYDASIATVNVTGVNAVKNNPASTTISFTGNKAGTTYYTVGNICYEIEVVDLSTITQKVEFWITNRTVTANNGEDMSISATDVYSEAGVKFSTLVPDTGVQTKDKNNNVAFWKGTRLASDNKQTTDGGVDKTQSGEDFTYIRYWNEKWSVSSDGTNWNEVNNGDQIVAYYLQVTKVTAEVTTEVADWGVDPYTYNDSDYVLIDYAVKYQSGERTPKSFPTEKTQAFHCNYNNGQEPSVEKSGNTYVRKIGTIKAEETSEYEVYMITLTPNSDDSTTTVKKTQPDWWSKNYTYTYSYDKGTEKVVWVDNEKNIPDDLKSNHADGYHVGGQPTVPGLKIMDQHAMLVTYYVRAKQTADSLTVRYVNEKTGKPFYTYSIIVNTGVTFDEGIALPETKIDGYTSLTNGKVTNKTNQSQYVSSDLSTMPEISSEYRYGGYKCNKVERSEEDGKTVTLYYSFDNEHTFVIDFGLPLKISARDLGLSDTSWTSSEVTGEKYGSVTLDKENHILKYTPTTILKGSEELNLKLSDGKNDGQDALHKIYIYPATTVYYEESFAEYSQNWTAEKKNDVNVKGIEKQETPTEEERGHNYGADKKYIEENPGPSNGSSMVTSVTGSTTAFEFTGTGVDIYANCTKGTGIASVKRENGSTVKILGIDTSMKAADNPTDATSGQNDVKAYNVPVASIQNLAYDTYTVTITFSKSSKNDTKTLSIDGFRVYNTMGNDTDAAAVYKEDGEESPTFVELRNCALATWNVRTGEADTSYHEQIKNALSQVYSSTDATTGAEIINNAVIVNGDKKGYSDKEVQDLLDNGPKNEVYLYPNQSISFNLAKGSSYQIGLKALNNTVSVGGTVAAVTGLYTSSTDMFYNIPSGEVTITNNNNPDEKNSGILAITKIKRLNSNSTNNSPDSFFAPIDENAIACAFMSLGYTNDTVITPTETPAPTKTPEKPVKLSTPKLGKVTSVSYNSVKVTWGKVKNADGYRVYMKENGKWKLLGKVNSTSYICKGLQMGKKYTFTVRAYKKTSNGVVLSAYDKKGISGTPKLSTPVLKSAKRSSSGVTFTWNKTAGATGYVVYRKANNGAWKVVKKVTTGTVYKDTAVKKNVKYTYTVRAFRKSGIVNIYSDYDKKGLSVK